MTTLAHAADHYVRAGATGSASGADWTNAWTALPAKLVRGDVYYVADGDYGALQLDQAEAGTERITIQKATAANHGTSAGWNDSYGAGQATFPGIVIATSYWTLDGVTGSGADKQSYGFATRVDTSGQDQSYVLVSAGNTKTFQGITLRHIGIECSGPGDNVSQVGVYSGAQSTMVSPVVQYLYVDDCENAITLTGSGWLIEHSYFDRQWSSPQHHGEQIDSWGTKDVTFRYNVIAHCAGTTCIGNADIDNWEIYGNVFADIQTGNGVIGVGSSSSATNTRIYNNTIVNNQSTSFLYQNNPGAGAGSGNVVWNNLFYASNGDLPSNGAGAIQSGYNAFFDSPNATTVSSDQIGSGDPFVDSAGGDYHLAAATKPGKTLPAPYDVDPDGRVRGADGTWDRGAFEYCADAACATTDAGPSPDAGPNDASAGAGGSSAGGSGAGGGAASSGAAGASPGDADAGTGAASSRSGSGQSGGCGCSAAPARPSGFFTGLGLFFFGLALRRRRARRRGSANRFR